MSHRRGSGVPRPPFPRPRHESIEIAMEVARIAKESGSFKDLVAAMGSVAMLSLEVLTTQQRHMLDLGYRKEMGFRSKLRLALEITRVREERRARRRRGLSIASEWIREAICKVEKEMDEICSDAKYIIDKHVLYYATFSEDKVFYHKLLGDLYKYSCFFKSGRDRVQTVSASLHEYESAEAFVLDLPGNSPLRLSLAVNYSSLCYKILDLSPRAREIITTALGAATGELNETSTEYVRILNERLQEIDLAAGGAHGGIVDGGYEAEVEDNDGADSSSSSGTFDSNGDGGAAEEENAVGNADGGETNTGVDNVVDEGFEAASILVGMHLCSRS